MLSYLFWNLCYEYKNEIENKYSYENKICSTSNEIKNDLQKQEYLFKKNEFYIIFWYFCNIFTWFIVSLICPEIKTFWIS